jgi:hypothetical protein
MALASNAIVSLADTKAFMRISSSSDDALLETLINAASTRIEQYCDRKFIAQNYRESYNCHGQRRLRLRNFPVTSVQRLATGSKLGLTVGSSVSTDLRASVEVQDDKLVLSRFSSNGTETNTEIAFSSHKSASALVTQIGGVTGFTASLNSDCLSTELYRAGAVNTITSSAQLYFPDQDDTAYRLHEDRATIEFVDQSNYAFFGTGTDQGPRFPVTFAGVVIDYTAGFTDIAAIPADLAMAAKMLVQFLFESGAKDPTLTAENIGSYSYTRGTDQLMQESGISALLSSYVDRKS